MADPAATSQAAHMVDFDNPHDPARDEYFKAGIPSKAVHLMLVGDRYPKETLVKDGVQYTPQDVGRIDKEKVELIYFHVLQPKYLSSTPSFSEFANAVFDACIDLKDGSIGGIDADDCENAQKAFEAVGMPPLPDADVPSDTTKVLDWCTGEASTLPVKPEGRIAFIKADEAMLGVIDLESCEVSRIGDLPAMVFPDKISWSPDATKFSFSFRVANETENIIVSDLKTKKGNMVTKQESQVFHTFPSWSPDGTRLAFSSWRKGHSQISVMDLRIGEYRQITDLTGQNEMPEWSPDGTHIAFSSNGDIAIVGSSGGTVTMLTNGSTKFTHPSWSPDGSRLAMMSTGGDIWVVTLADGKLSSLTNDEVFDGFPTWSPDSEFIAFQSVRDGQADIFLITANGMNLMRLTHITAAYTYWLRR